MPNYPRRWKDPYGGASFAVVDKPGGECRYEYYSSQDEGLYTPMDEQACDSLAAMHADEKSGRWLEVTVIHTEQILYLKSLAKDLRTENERLRELIDVP